MITRKLLYGLNFISADNCSEVVDDILSNKDALSANLLHAPLLITPNVDDVVKFNRPEHQDIFNYMKKSVYILPDGQFVVWSSKLLGRTLKRRLPGSDLFPVFWKRVAGSDLKILLIAPDAKVGEQLKKEHSLLEYYVPPFFSEHDMTAVNCVIDKCKQLAIDHSPDFILLGIRFPKQHAIAMALSEMYKDTPRNSKIPLIMLLGASFEFYLGIKKRAPRFVRFLGMEWFHRFVQEPKRLFRRFFIEDMAFFPIVWREFLGKNN